MSTKSSVEVKPSVAGVEGAVLAAYPAEWAEPWDRVGLLAGDPGEEVTGVFVTLDATHAAVKKATAVGANVVVSHHPAFLTPPSSLKPGPGAAGVVFSALKHEIALIAAHTNLDRAPEAGEALPDLLGLVSLRPIERGLAEMSHVSVFAPRDDVVAIVDAMAQAGAGRIGRYDRCSFRAPGIGEFTPSEHADPTVGAPGEVTTASEERVEMVCPRAYVTSVVEAARWAHPYEEPVIVVTDSHIARSSARLGMYCSTEAPTALSELASEVARRTGSAPRVWGDPSRIVESVVTATGSASSLIPDVLTAGPDCLIAGEVRYHDALEASAAGLAILELGHDVSEWPLVPVLAKAVQATIGLESDQIHVDLPNSAWWTP